MKCFVIGLAVPAMFVAGCTSMSGLSGSSSYGCKAPEGVACDSVSGTYANALQNNLPSQRRPSSQDGPSPAGSDVATSNFAPAARPPVAARAGLAPTPIALRSAPRVLRLWIKPWEDADRDLYDQSYVYVQVDRGQWQIEHVQRQIRDAYTPLKAPPRAAEAKDGTPASNAMRAIPRPGSPTPGLPSPPGLLPKLPAADPRGAAPDENNE